MVKRIRTDESIEQISYHELPTTGCTEAPAILTEPTHGRVDNSNDVMPLIGTGNVDGQLCVPRHLDPRFFEHSARLSRSVFFTVGAICLYQTQGRSGLQLVRFSSQVGTYSSCLIKRLFCDTTATFTSTGRISHSG